MFRSIKRGRKRQARVDEMCDEAHRIEEELNLVLRSGLFDADWYCGKYPKVPAAGQEPLLHYCTIGAAADYDPNRLFDAAWYRAQNPGAGSNPLVHFLQQGAREHRSPSSDFDVDWYIDTYVDVAVSDINPLYHFLKHGEAEGRDPNPNFSTLFYREAYMQTLPLEASPIDHYRRIGRARGHQTLPASLQPQTLSRLALTQSFGLEIPELLRHIDLMLVRPFFFCIVNDAVLGSRSRAESSLHNQLYPDWTLCASVDEAVRQSSELGDTPWFVVLLDGESTVAPSALYCLASTINRSPLTELITCDADSSGSDSANPLPCEGALDKQPLGDGQFLFCVRGPAVHRVLNEPPSLGTRAILQSAAARAQVPAHISRILAYRDIGLPQPAQVEGIHVPGPSEFQASRPVTLVHRHAVRPSGRTAVVYLARGSGDDWLSRFDRFVQSYRYFGAGAPHELVVVFKGFASDDALERARTVFDGVVDEQLDLDDLAFDIGAYAEAAMRIECDRICFLNTNSEIVSANWLIKLIVNLEQPGIGLVGATGSHEAHLGADMRFPPFPNIHIRTNAFMLRAADARAILGRLEIRSKHDAHMAEHGFNSITRRIVGRGLAPLVVGRNGRGYAPQWWAGSQTFRMGTQSNLLIHDNQTRYYESLSSEHQMPLRFGAWGLQNEKSPFREATP